MKSKKITRLLCCLSLLGCLSVAFARDPFQQPFHHNSIWNTPIGGNAEYVHAQIQPATAYGMTIDEDLIVLTPEAPTTDIYLSTADWDGSKDRCQIDGGLLFSAPIPDEYVVSPETWEGSTPNSGLAVLMEDWRTIKQTQPFARCSAGENGTSHYVFGDEDLYGNGYYGAHGATQLSAIGGTIRLGELVPAAGPIRHALKVNIYAAKNVYYDSQTKGYRWPAKSADSYAPGNYGTKGNPVKECRMGALLALPASMSVDELNLETEPARMLAQAFQDYGAYLVDDTAWDVYAIVTEWSPRGRVKDEFEQAWGFSMSTNSQTTPWARDMRKIFTNLHIVNNNTANSIGGGGKPRAPLAEPLIPNKPPKVSLKVSAVTGEPPLTVKFDASQTTDPEKDPITFHWDFGDGAAATGATVSHTFSQPGIYKVTLFPDDGFPLAKYVMREAVIQVGAIMELQGNGIGTPGSRNNRGNSFEKALDGNLDTFFEGPDAGASWVGRDFGEPAQIIKIGFAPRAGAEIRMVGGQFQGANSADFSDTAVLYVIQTKPRAGKMNEIILNHHTPYRYARHIGPAKSYGVIAELVFYGTKAVRVDEPSPLLVEDFKLHNFPNPFNPETTIVYSLGRTQLLSVEVFNILGHKVSTLISGIQTTGEHSIEWNGTNDLGQPVPCGVYLYRLTGETRVETGKMMLLK